MNRPCCLHLDSTVMYCMHFGIRTTPGDTTQTFFSFCLCLYVSLIFCFLSPFPSFSGTWREVLLTVWGRDSLPSRALSEDWWLEGGATEAFSHHFCRYRSTVGQRQKRPMLGDWLIAGFSQLLLASSISFSTLILQTSSSSSVSFSECQLKHPQQALETPRIDVSRSPWVANGCYP